ncbi:DUF1062 domain-containing protein [Nocardia brasiliensis]|uniref:Uncharacterized protein n=1 Tax=Nocardia brasiliensis (strain ATCC 700358 / HUJEG-1) TaxID=1133849 RepID=K0EQJ9_NOCB7|nr:DUF1062 domain-containing protein [Nocardia brasiliensis]AFU02063.1 hypothetical protein O3I_020520 [Nocardia brasiliensis ATCC 700358]
MRTERGAGLPHRRSIQGPAADNSTRCRAARLDDARVRQIDRNRLSLDWDQPWRLVTDGSDYLNRAVHFAARIPVRPVRLIAQGCGLPRAEVERLLGDGRLVSAIRLSGTVSDDFTFTLKR